METCRLCLDYHFDFKSAFCVSVKNKKLKTVCNNDWKLFSMSTLKFARNKFTVLYFREDKSTCRICNVTLEEKMLFILLQSFLYSV
jgi:hypothetical protein